MTKQEEIKKIYRTPEKTAFIKNFANVEALQKEEALTIEGHKVTEDILAQYREFIRLVMEIYGEDWDINVRVFGGRVDISHIDLLFKDITITNSEGNSHYIKDLYVRLKLYINPANKIGISSILGGRGSVTLKEYSCGYQHSHLHSTTYGTSPDGPMFDDFCTGSGEINDYRSRYNNAIKPEEKQEHLEALLMQLFTLVSWESLEGVPYVYMSNIRYDTSRGSSELTPVNVSATSLCNYFTSIVGTLTREGKLPVKDIDVDIIVSGGYNKITVSFNEDYWTRLISTPETEEFVYVQYSGGYHRESAVIDHLRRSSTGNPHGVDVHEPVKNTGYIFNGKEIYLDIYDYHPTEQKEQQVELIKTIPDDFKYSLQQHFEKELNEQQAKRIIAERYA